MLICSCGAWPRRWHAHRHKAARPIWNRVNMTVQVVGRRLPLSSCADLLAWPNTSSGAPRRSSTTACSRTGGLVVCSRYHLVDMFLAGSSALECTSGLGSRCAASPVRWRPDAHLYPFSPSGLSENSKAISSTAAPRCATRNRRHDFAHQGFEEDPRRALLACVTACPTVFSRSRYVRTPAVLDGLPASPVHMSESVGQLEAGPLMTEFVPI